VAVILAEVEAQPRRPNLPGGAVVVKTRLRKVALIRLNSGYAANVPAPAPEVALVCVPLPVLGHPIVGLYSATKAAEIQLARSWAAEFGPRGIRVNTVSPGATRTPINATDGDVIAQMTAGIPAGRPGTPDEIADAVTWLLSDQARYIHGAELAVDGGITTARSA